MKRALISLAMLASASQAQIVAPPRVILPAQPLVRLPPNVTIPPCLINPPAGDAIIGEKVIGEKSSTGVIGEKVVGEKVIGEKVIGEKVIGEKGVGPASLRFGDQWNASQFTSYNHVLVGAPGRVTLSLYGCSSASGGETVAVYLADSNGNRKTGWRHFVIATRNGNNRETSLTLPKPRAGEKLSRLPIVVVVENASGRPHVGEYRLTVSR